MKKALMIGLTLLIGVAFVTSVSAQSATEKAAKAATDTTQEKAKTAGDTTKDKATKTAPKETRLRYGGEVTAINMAAKTLTVKGKKGDMTFDITDVRMMEEPKAGDTVMVQYTNKDGKMVADSVVGMAAKKTEKKDVKPTGKQMAPEKPATPPSGK